MKDVTGKEIRPGDTVRTRWGYSLTVKLGEDGHLFGSLVCDPGHSCRDIPYAMNDGDDLLVIDES